jgi:hypothetical protein
MAAGVPSCIPLVLTCTCSHSIAGNLISRLHSLARHAFPNNLKSTRVQLRHYAVQRC